MLFVDFLFLPFFLVVFAVHWLLPRHRWRKLWLLAASYLFYAAWDWRFLSLILVSTVVDYVVGLRLTSLTVDRERRRWLLVSLVVNLGMLGFFKYFNFFVESAARFLAAGGFETSPRTLAIVLPVGISFYTFQTLSYSIDVYKRKIPATRDLGDLALFVAFFPQLVAGPIMRASEFLPQLAAKTVLGRTDVRAALVLFSVGFLKKACISDGLSPVVDEYFAEPSAYGVQAVWLATLAYAVQIYCDFSGYSDMAIACAALLGYRLCVNFARPYFAADIAAFWRRWHISLSTWLRDYLYIPLGGNRGPRWFQYRNLLLTMLLGGLWHGAGWNFIVWGALHGVGLGLHRLWRSARGARSNGAERGAIGTLATFLFVCVCWIFFRAESLGDALTACRAFCLFSSVEARALPDCDPALLSVLFLALAVLHWLSSRGVLEKVWRRAPTWAFVAGLAGFYSLVLPFVPLKVQPFIYFQF